MNFDELISMEETETETGPLAPPPPPPAPARDLRSTNTPNSGSPEVPNPGRSEVPKSEGSEVRKSRSSKPRKPRKKKSSTTAPEGPKWASLERKDALLWPEQISGLTELRRDLQRRRRATGGGGERITENTLIRVAVALLLEHGHALAGVDEDELRESLSSELRESESSGVTMTENS